jgi:hypothetical protein
MQIMQLHDRTASISTHSTTAAVHSTTGSCGLHIHVLEHLHSATAHWDGRPVANPNRHATWHASFGGDVTELKPLTALTSIATAAHCWCALLHIAVSCVPCQVVIMGDGQATQNDFIVKPNVRKVRRPGAAAVPVLLLNTELLQRWWSLHA